MKVKKLIKVLGALNDTGEVACDMYTLHESEYYSQSQGTIAISEMEFTHVLRAFRKLCDDEVTIDTKESKANAIVSREAYQVMWDNCKELEKQIKYWSSKYDELNVIGVNDSIWKEKYEEEVKNAEYWKNLYYTSQPKGCGYVFSEIPNDTDGQEFVDKMKKYFNKLSYKMRVRGQHIKPELKGTGATYWGQTRDESTHVRVYIDAKRGE